jgi:hypothetical protein
MAFKTSKAHNEKFDRTIYKVARNYRQVIFKSI